MNVGWTTRYNRKFPTIQKKDYGKLVKQLFLKLTYVFSSSWKIKGFRVICQLRGLRLVGFIYHHHISALTWHGEPIDWASLSIQLAQSQNRVLKITWPFWLPGDRLFGHSDPILKHYRLLSMANRWHHWGILLLYTGAVSIFYSPIIQMGAHYKRITIRRWRLKKYKLKFWHLTNP